MFLTLIISMCTNSVCPQLPSIHPLASTPYDKFLLCDAGALPYNACVVHTSLFCLVFNEAPFNCFRADETDAKEKIIRCTDWKQN